MPKEPLNKARQELLVNKKPDNAIKILLEAAESKKKLSVLSQNIYNTTLALAYYEKKEYKKAAAIYRENSEHYQAGFCELLSGNRSEAEKLWLNCPTSAISHWGLCMLDFIDLKPNPRLPSYLQIRNFLEIDISNFITANKLRYAENIIKNERILISVNLESYKLIGRVLLNFGFFNLAKKYLLKSLEIVDHDSETFFHLGQYFYAVGDFQQSTKMLTKCIELNSYYTPAVTLLKKMHLN